DERRGRPRRASRRRSWSSPRCPPHPRHPPPLSGPRRWHRRTRSLPHLHRFRPGVLEEFPEPPHHPLTHHPNVTEHALAAAPVTVLLEPVEDETDCRRIHGTRDGVNQAVQMKRGPEPHRQPEDTLGERRH